MSFLPFCVSVSSYLPSPETLNKGTVRLLAASRFSDQSKKSFLILLYSPRLALPPPLIYAQVALFRGLHAPASKHKGLCCIFVFFIFSCFFCCNFVFYYAQVALFCCLHATACLQAISAPLSPLCPWQYQMWPAQILFHIVNICIGDFLSDPSRG